MIKQNKKMILFTLVLLLLPIVMGLFLWNQLPDTVVTHWGGLITSLMATYLRLLQ